MLRSRKIRVGLRAGLGALALAALPLTAGCSSASYGAVTQMGYDPGEGVSADTGHIDLRNIVVVSDTEELGTLVAVVVNHGDKDDKLTGVKVADGRSTVSTTDDGVELAPDDVVALGTDSGAVSALPASVESPEVVAGHTVRLTFEFENSASVSVDANVVSREGPYAEVPAATPEGAEAPDQS